MEQDAGGNPLSAGALTNQHAVRPSVAVIVVNYNGLADTVACLASLRDSTYPCHIVLVDNASAEDPTTIIREQFPEVRMMRSATNLGFAGANNIAMGWALKNGYDYVFLLNNDATVGRDTIARLLEEMERRPRWGAASPKILYHNSTRIWCLGGTYSETGAFSRHIAMDELDSEARQEVTDTGITFLSGCALLIRRQALTDVGLLEERYFMYAEDVDFSLRLLGAGWHLGVVGGAIVWHKVSSSTGGEGGNKLSPFRAYYYARNPFILLRLRRRGLLRLIGMFSQFMIVCPYRVLEMLRTGSLRSFPHYLRGLLDGLRGRHGPRKIL